jgi:hypothetical protein
MTTKSHTPSTADIAAYTPSKLKALGNAELKAGKANESYDAACAAILKELTAAGVNNVMDITKRSTVTGAAFQTAFHKVNYTAKQHAVLFDADGAWKGDAVGKGKKNFVAAKNFYDRVSRIAKRMVAIQATPAGEKATGKKSANKAPHEKGLIVLTALKNLYKRDLESETPKSYRHVHFMTKCQEMIDEIAEAQKAKK